MTRYYGSKGKRKILCLNDLVLPRVFLFTKETRTETLGPNWEGPYRIKEEGWPRIYKIEGMDGKA